MTRKKNMKPGEYRAILAKLGLGVNHGHELGLFSEAQSKRFSAGTAEISEYLALILRLMATNQDGLLKKIRHIATTPLDIPSL